MFKNLILYRIEGDTPDVIAFEEAMDRQPFVPCAPSQPTSFGWVPPREEGGPLLEVVGGQWIVKLMIETRMLPGPVIKRRAEELAKQIEQETGRRPGKRQMRELKDEALAEPLPRAFTKQATVLAWIDPKTRLVAVDAATAGKCEPVANALIAACPAMNLHGVNTVHSVGGAMAAWMLDGNPPPLFAVEQDAVLQGGEEGQQVVRYTGMDLDSEEVRAHIEGGRVPSRLAMTFNGRVSFALNDRMQLLALDFLDVCFESRPDNAADAFDADVAIATGELIPLISAMIDTLGGLKLPPIVEAAQNGASEPVPYIGPACDDPLYAEACTVVRKTGHPSISGVQRHLRIGYNRAARLLELMEAEGLVSAMDFNGKRTVIAHDDVGARVPA